LHDVGYEHRVQLGLLEAMPRAGLAVPRASSDAVVCALRHLDLAARDARCLRGAHPRRGDPRAPSARSPRSPAARVHHHPVGAPRPLLGGPFARTPPRRVRGRRAWPAAPPPAPLVATRHSVPPGASSRAPSSSDSATWGRLTTCLRSGALSIA